MGEGFVVMQSNDVDIYYYQDEPGMHTHTHTHTQLHTDTHTLCILKNVKPTKSALLRQGQNQSSFLCNNTQNCLTFFAFEQLINSDCKVCKPLEVKGLFGFEVVCKAFLTFGFLFNICCQDALGLEIFLSLCVFVCVCHA